MVDLLEEITAAYKSNAELSEEVKKDAEKMRVKKGMYLNSAVLSRSVEYDCDCGDGCDGPDCDTHGYKRD